MKTESVEMNFFANKSFYETDEKGEGVCHQRL